jgi:uncharacterized protein (DUF58 family)
MTRQYPLKWFFYRLFRGWYALTQRWRARFTRSGKFVQVVLLISAIIGVNTRQAVAYQITGFLAALLLLALLAGRKFKTGLRVQRFLPRYATVGVPFSYQISVQQDGKEPLAGLHVFEVNRDPRPDFAQFCHAHEPGAATRNWFDRTVGYYRWSWLIRLNSVARSEEMAVPTLPAQGSRTLAWRCLPHARGVLSLAGVALARHDPFGLCRVYRVQALPGSVLVLPRTYALPPLNLPGSLHPQPEHRVASSHKGDGDDIAGLREYRPGDARRDIHWKSFARLGVPVVKEYQADFAERHALLLDTCGAPAGVAFEEAVALAASLVGDIGRGDCLLDLLFVGEEAHCFTMGPGELQAEALLRVLAGVQACPDQTLAAALANIASRRVELSGCICILLDWDSEREQMVNQLHRLGLPLLLWLVAEVRPANCPPQVLHLQPGKIEQGLAQL